MYQSPSRHTTTVMVTRSSYSETALSGEVHCIIVGDTVFKHVLKTFISPTGLGMGLQNPFMSVQTVQTLFIVIALFLHKEINCIVLLLYL